MDSITAYLRLLEWGAIAGLVGVVLTIANLVILTVMLYQRGNYPRR